MAFLSRSISAALKITDVRNTPRSFLLDRLLVPEASAVLLSEPEAEPIHKPEENFAARQAESMD